MTWATIRDKLETLSINQRQQDNKLETLSLNNDVINRRPSLVHVIALTSCFNVRLFSVYVLRVIKHIFVIIDLLYMKLYSILVGYS